MNTSLTVYVDSDGVVADMSKALTNRLGLYFDTDNADDIWAAIRKYNKEVGPWFIGLEQMSDAQELMDFVFSNFENVEFLSASGGVDGAAKDKIQWLVENFGATTPIHIVQTSVLKAEYATHDTLLIDDRESSTVPFEEAGGLVILHTSAKSTIKKLKYYL